jgi:hypothetical protein
VLKKFFFKLFSAAEDDTKVFHLLVAVVSPEVYEVKKGPDAIAKLAVLEMQGISSGFIILVS